MRASILLAAIVPLTFATPILPRATDAQRIVTAINNIQAKIATVTKSLNAFNKGDLTSIPEVLTIQSQTDDIGTAVQSATKVAQSSKKLDSDDSATIATAVISLQGTIDPLLNLIVAKKPAFDAAILGVGSVSPQVKKSLQDQKGYANAFGKALTKKLDPSFAGAAPIIQQQINDSFNKAIKAYAKPGGIFALPPFPSFNAFKDAMSRYQNGGVL